jgi:hypothetical protein
MQGGGGPGACLFLDCTEDGDIWVIEAVAVRCVTDARNKATNPAIKKNAGDTLAKLGKLH